jgi:hypothetical protein
LEGLKRGLARKVDRGEFFRRLEEFENAAPEGDRDILVQVNRYVEFLNFLIF